MGSALGLWQPIHSGLVPRTNPSCWFFFANISAGAMDLTWPKSLCCFKHGSLPWLPSQITWETFKNTNAWYLKLMFKNWISDICIFRRFPRMILLGGEEGELKRAGLRLIIMWSLQWGQKDLLAVASHRHLSLGPLLPRPFPVWAVRSAVFRQGEQPGQIQVGRQPQGLSAACEDLWHLFPSLCCLAV